METETSYNKRPVWQWIVIYLIIAAVVYGLIYYVYKAKKSSNSIYPTTTNTQSTNGAGTTVIQPTTTNNQQQSASAATINYTNSGFSPKSVTIKKGESVTFKNTSSRDVRVASNPHPAHNGYPTTVGCVSSTFDSCANIAPGQSWSFKFDIAGNWGFHNHLNPTEGGTVKVQ